MYTFFLLFLAFIEILWCLFQWRGFAWRLSQVAACVILACLRNDEGGEGKKKKKDRLVDAEMRLHNASLRFLRLVFFFVVLLHL